MYQDYIARSPRKALQRAMKEREREREREREADEGMGVYVL